MSRLLWLIVFIFSTSSLARVKELSLEVRKIKTLRHAYYPQKRDWRGFVGLNWNLVDKHDLFFWNNQTAFYGDDSQVRHIYWKYDIGVKYKCVKLVYHHKSEHSADHNKFDIGHTDRFPLEDSFGFIYDMSCN